MTLLTLALAAAPANAEYLEPFEPLEKTLPASIPEIELLSGYGDVVVSRDTSASKTRFIATPQNWQDDCELRFDGDATKAIVEVARDEGGTLRRCKIDFEIVLAGDTALAIEGKRGYISVWETTAPVAIDMRGGQIEINDVTGPLDLYLGSGSIRGTTWSQEVSAYVSVGRIALDGLIASIEAEVGMGGVDLTYAAVPSGRIWARTAVGRVSVDFPYGSWLDTTLDTKVGRVKSQIPFSDDAYTHLEASTGVGNIHIGTVLDMPGADLATSVTEPDDEEEAP